MSRSLSTATFVTCSVGFASFSCWLISKWISYKATVKTLKSKGPTIGQFIPPFSLSSGLMKQKYTREIWRIMSGIFQDFNSPLFYLVTYRDVSVFVNNPTLFHEICKKKHEIFPKAVELYDIIRVFGDNLVTTDGEIWKRHRRCAAAAFSDTNNKLVFQTTISTVQIMFEAWSKTSGKFNDGQSIVHCLHDMTQLTLSIISSAAFGMKIDSFGSSNGDSDVVHSMQKNQSRKFKLSFTRYNYERISNSFNYLSFVIIAFFFINFSYSIYALS